MKTTTTAAGSKIVDVAGEARAFDRFEFIARFVERCTRLKGGRALVGGMQVKSTRAGWVYTVAGITACAPTDARRLYEMLLRSELNFFVRQAEEFRADVLTA